MPDDQNDNGQQQGDDDGRKDDADTNKGDSKKNDDDDGTDWKAEARKWESRAKSNRTAAEELETLKREGMKPDERALEDAKKAGRAEAQASVGKRLVDAEVKALAAGRKVDVGALLEGLDRSKFLDDDGEPKSKDIEKWLDRVAPKGNTRTDTGQGARSGGGGGNDMNSLIRNRLGRG
jgi:hypothetical protein